MKLEVACEAKFAGHMTFAPRYLWPKKAYDGCSEPELFKTREGREKLVEELAVGIRMVDSIRYWGQAFRIFTEEPAPKRKDRLIRPTAIGETIFSDDGWDPFCEHPDTLWLLHWWLLAPKSVAPSWWLAFNKFAGIKFTADELEQFIADQVTNFGSRARSSVKKDVDCFIQMYAFGHSVRATFDDQLNHPFRDLNLLRPSDREPGVFRFLIGPKVTLTPEVAAFACLDFLARTEKRASTVPMSRLASVPGSPGKVFNLTETALTDLLEIAASRSSEFTLTSAAGIPQIALNGDAAAIATNLIRARYERLIGAGHCKDPAGLLAGKQADLVAQGPINAPCLT